MFRKIRNISILLYFHHILERSFRLAISILLYLLYAVAWRIGVYLTKIAESFIRTRNNRKAFVPNKAINDGENPTQSVDLRFRVCGDHLQGSTFSQNSRLRPKSAKSFTRNRRFRNTSPRQEMENVKQKYKDPRFYLDSRFQIWELDPTGEFSYRIRFCG